MVFYILGRATGAFATPDFVLALRGTNCRSRLLPPAARAHESRPDRWMNDRPCKRCLVSSIYIKLVCLSNVSYLPRFAGVAWVLLGPSSCKSEFFVPWRGVVPAGPRADADATLFTPCREGNRAAEPVARINRSSHSLRTTLSMSPSRASSPQSKSTPSPRLPRQTSKLNRPSSGLSIYRQSLRKQHDAYWLAFGCCHYWDGSDVTVPRPMAPDNEALCRKLDFPVNLSSVPRYQVSEMAIPLSVRAPVVFGLADHLVRPSECDIPVVTVSSFPFHYQRRLSTVMLN
jgi:hypothetical protein